MKESLESLECKIAKRLKCNMPGCLKIAEWRPFIEIPAIAGLDRTPPKAEIEFVLCESHMVGIDPSQFLGKPVRDAIETNLIQWAGRPLVNPVDWSKAVVGFERLLIINVVEG